MPPQTDPSIKVIPIGQKDWGAWNITQNLTDRWGDINDHDASNKPLAQLEENPALITRLRDQMWGEITFVTRKDGRYGILFEVEFTSIESDGDTEDESFKARLLAREEVVARIQQYVLPLVTDYPDVQFGIPDFQEIAYGRPAVWSFAPDGSLNQEQRERIGNHLLCI